MTLEFFRVIRNNQIIYEETNKKNILHTQGQQQILNALFVGGPTSNMYIPAVYYLGLDNRSSLDAANLLSDVIEPSGGGYARQGVSSTTGFTVQTNGSTAQATTGIVSFSSSTGWGPVQNLFLTNVGSGTSGILYSSVSLSSAVTLSSDDSVTLKFSLSLGSC